MTSISGSTPVADAYTLVIAIPVGPILESTPACATLPTLAAQTAARGRDVRIMRHPRDGELPMVELRMAWATRCEGDEGLKWLRAQLAHVVREVVGKEEGLSLEAP